MYIETRRLSLLPRILELEQALFFNYSDAVLKLPTSVINVIHLDEVGQIWFMVHRPQQQLSQFEHSFRAKLDFYKKGKSFHMQVSGKACIVNDPEEINNAEHLNAETRELVCSTMVLIKMKAEVVEYFPHPQEPARQVKFTAPQFQPSAIFKTLQYIVKDIIPVFQSH